VRGWKLGTYRTERASIQSSEGQELFVPAPPTSVAEEMLSLLDWVNRRAPAYDPVVAATVMFHEFESIHPFGDGNGRVGRSLFHLFLQSSGLHYSHLCKIDRDLLSQGELYYQLLAYTDDTGSYRELVDLVSESVLKSYEDAHRLLSEKDLLSSDLDEAAKRLLRMARRNAAWFSVAEATGWVGSVGEQTVRKRLNQLEEIGALEKKGRTKSCRFRMSRPLADIRERLQPLRDKALQGR
jgi:Fic family protein